MSSSTENRESGTRKRAMRTPAGTLPSGDVEAGRRVVYASRVAPAPQDPRVHLEPHVVMQLQERRRRRRAHVPPMYTQALVRVLSQKGPPLEGHVVDISETGVAVDVDSLIPVGQAVTIEFRVAGLGRIAHEEWSEFVAAAIVVRHHDVEEFPAGPYQIGLKFVRISTMSQAQIARFVATQPG